MPIIPIMASARSTTPPFDTFPAILVAADVPLKDPSEFSVPSHQIPLVWVCGCIQLYIAASCSRLVALQYCQHDSDVPGEA
jgi:hypothetical protein